MNPVGKQRSPFNSDKTKLNRPALFQKLGGDPRRSFFIQMIHKRKNPMLKLLQI